MGVQDDYNEAWEAGAKHERERCALLAEGLALKWEASAKRMRTEGSYWGGWLWRKRYVLPKWEKAARDIDAAAHGLRIIAMGCRGGWDPRKLDPDPSAGVHPPGRLPTAGEII
jgi:hypothetical protein